MLSIEEGKDYDQVLKSQLPYELLENLGHGGSGAVEKVKDVLTGELFARKIIRRPRARALKEKQAVVFRNEVKIIRRLGYHRHIIRLFATYTTENEFGLVLHPVASDRDLEQYLAYYQNDVQADDAAFPDSHLSSMTATLEQAFGCLISGMAYMHKKRIRHKDVKLQNILIHEGQVLYTDFGYSFDSNERSRSLTQGRPGPMTAKYSAPEVLAHEPRDSSSDIYSLGCVFITMLSALTSASTLDVQEIPSFASSMEDIHQHMTYWHTNSRTARLPAVITQMTRRDPSERMCAVHIADRILCLPGLSCQECAMHTIDPGSECTKLENCVRIAQSDRFISLSPMRRTRSENAIPYGIIVEGPNGDRHSSEDRRSRPVMRNIIRQWSLSHLEQCAMQKLIYLNVLEDNGIESSVKVDWKGRASRFWSRDGFGDTENTSNRRAASTGHEHVVVGNNRALPTRWPPKGPRVHPTIECEARYLNDLSATPSMISEELGSPSFFEWMKKDNVASCQPVSRLLSPSRDNQFVHEVEHDTGNRTPAPVLGIWDEQQHVLRDLYLANLVADLPKYPSSIETEVLLIGRHFDRTHQSRSVDLHPSFPPSSDYGKIVRYKPDFDITTPYDPPSPYARLTPLPATAIKGALNPTANQITPNPRPTAQARRNTITWFRSLFPRNSPSI